MKNNQFNPNYNPFIVGDKVYCWNSDVTRNLMFQGRYTIKEIFGNYVILNKLVGKFHYDRFRSAGADFTNEASKP